MADTFLRLVSDQDVFESVASKQPIKVTVSMQQVLPLLVDAVRTNRRWIHDFSNETVEISADLYEVLLAYQEMRRAS
jgi:hypothetical protein